MTRTHLCCLVIASMGGCVERSASTGPAPTTAPVAAATYDRQPEVLLSSRKPDRLIVAVDFAGTKAMNKAIPVDERRRYVLEQVVVAYAAYAKKERDDQRVRLLALSVPNRDDYARGDFRNMDELAVCDTTHATARAADKDALERSGTVEWRAGLGQ